MISEEPDSDRVELNSEASLLYWTYHFNVSREELEEAVDSVGDSAAAIAAYLNVAP